MTVNFDILPEEMKCDIEETIFSIRMTRCLAVGAVFLTEKEKSFLNDVITTIENCIKERNNIKSQDDFSEQLKIADNLYSQLEQHKTIKLDLTLYDKYYDDYITPWLSLWRIGEILEITTGIKEDSYEKYKNLMINHLFPMLLCQIIGIISSWLYEKYSVL